MKRRPTAPPAGTDAAQTLKIPSLTPRNLVATNPLLKKSGAHQDKRRKTLLEDAALRARTAKKQQRSHDED